MIAHDRLIFQKRKGTNKSHEQEALQDFLAYTTTDYDTYPLFLLDHEPIQDR